MGAIRFVSLDRQSSGLRKLCQCFSNNWTTRQAFLFFFTLPVTSLSGSLFFSQSTAAAVCVCHRIRRLAIQLLPNAITINNCRHARRTPQTASAVVVFADNAFTNEGVVTSTFSLAASLANSTYGLARGYFFSTRSNGTTEAGQNEAGRAVSFGASSLCLSTMYALCTAVNGAEQHPLGLIG